MVLGTCGSVLQLKSCIQASRSIKKRCPYSLYRRTEIENLADRGSLTFNFTKLSEPYRKGDVRLKCGNFTCLKVLLWSCFSSAGRPAANSRLHQGAEWAPDHSLISKVPVWTGILYWNSAAFTLQHTSSPNHSSKSHNCQTSIINEVWKNKFWNQLDLCMNT